MDRRIRYMAGVVVACFVVLFVQLNNLQIAHAPALLSNPNAIPAPTNPYSEPRGDIISADGTVLAETNASNDRIGEQRSYPEGSLFADVTGYYDAVDVTATGVEAAYNSQLVEHASASDTLKEILTEHTGTNDVVLTVRTDLQKVARQALAGREGAMVAIDPRSGAILALYGNPTFDPNAMASHSPATVAKAYATYYTAYADKGDAPGAPLVDQATDHTWAPGSTMKVITTAAIFDHDPSLADMVWPVESSTKLPLTSLLLHNFGGESCGGTLVHILTVSCDTAYALVGVSLGPRNLAEEANAFGYNKVPPIDLSNVYGAPDAVAPTFPSPAAIPGSLAAYSAIGQYGNQESALGNALVAAGIANGGVIMAPHVLSRVVDYAGETANSYQPHQWLRATSADTANQVRTDMLSVAESGTAVGIFPPADHVAAKTGTAETSGGCTANWLIAMAPAGPGETPRVAVAAVIPAQAGVACGSESVTGASVAGPAVGQLLTAALAVTK